MDKAELFRDDADRKAFMERLGRYLESTDSRCYAYALMTNHFHLLTITGREPLSKLMQSMLTSYAGYYNRRHDRTGKLYENRYKSILCEYDRYFLALVRYIHLNPIRAGLVKGMKGLRGYKWTGHRALIEEESIKWLQTNEVLGMFGHRKSTARRKYDEFVAAGLDIAAEEDLEGGGLIRSSGGIWQVRESLGVGEKLIGGERILGDTNFVTEVIRKSGQKEKRSARLRRLGWDIDRVVGRASEVVGVAPSLVRGSSKNRVVSRARALACKWLVKDLGYRGIDVARSMEITPGAISVLVARGEDVEDEEKVVLAKS